MMLLLSFTSVHLVSALTCVLAVTTETIVGVAGQAVTLPCRLEAANQRGVEVCWGRGEPSLFTCHDTVINGAGERVTFRKSGRYSAASSSSLTILRSRASDSGFYHCRVQLPGLFNDQTTSVHLIIISPGSVSANEDRGNLTAPQTTTTGSDVTGDDATEPVVALVQFPVEQQQGHSLQMFIGNTVRGSFIIFIPALLLTAAYRVWREWKSKSAGRLNQSEEEEGSSV